MPGVYELLGRSTEELAAGMGIEQKEDSDSDIDL